MAQDLGIIVAVALVAYTLLIVLATLAIRPRVRNLLDKGKIEFIELGSNDRGSRRFLAKSGQEGLEQKNGPFVKLEASSTYIDRETNRRRVVFNGDTGAPIKALEGEGHEEVDGNIFAAVMASKDIERVQRSHGGINWTQLAVIGGFVVLGLVAILGWIMKAIVESQGKTGGP